MCILLYPPQGTAAHARDRGAQFQSARALRPSVSHGTAQRGSGKRLPRPKGRVAGVRLRHDVRKFATAYSSECRVTMYGGNTTRVLQKLLRRIDCCKVVCTTWWAQSLHGARRRPKPRCAAGHDGFAVRALLGLNQFVAHSRRCVESVLSTTLRGAKKEKVPCLAAKSVGRGTKPALQRSARAAAHPSHGDAAD